MSSFVRTQLDNLKENVQSGWNFTKDNKLKVGLMIVAFALFIAGLIAHKEQPAMLVCWCLGALLLFMSVMIKKK